MLVVVMLSKMLQLSVMPDPLIIVLVTLATEGDVWSIKLTTSYGSCRLTKVSLRELRPVIHAKYTFIGATPV